MSDILANVMKPPEDQICASLYAEPEKWGRTLHCIKHENGTELWVARGNFSVWDSPSGPRQFSWAGKRNVRKAHKAWLRRPMPQFFEEGR